MRRAALLPLLALLTATVGAAEVPPGQETEHVVRQGETLNGIANRAGVARDSIIEANKLEPPYLIRIGQKLEIPRQRSAAASSASSPFESETEHVVQAGETLGGIANRTGVAQGRIIQANGLEPPYLIRIGQKLKIPRERSAAARAASPSPTPSPGLETEHIVQEGETLSGIAARENVSGSLIAEANGLAPPYVIRVGQRLVIPRARQHTVSEGETGFAIAYAYAVPWKDIAIANAIDPDAPLRTGQKLVIPTVVNPPPLSPPPSPAPAPSTRPAPSPSPAAVTASRFIWPVNGTIRRDFAPRELSNHHDGMDIQAPRGTAVRATAAGKVIFADDKDDYGKLVIIAHDDNWHSVYGYLERITVKKGERVAKGERIGLVGSTGIAKGDELHFELRRHNRPVDPKTELPEGP